MWTVQPYTIQRGREPFNLTRSARPNHAALRGPRRHEALSLSRANKMPKTAGGAPFNLRRVATLAGARDRCTLSGTRCGCLEGDPTQGSISHFVDADCYPTFAHQFGSAAARAAGGADCPPNLRPVRPILAESYATPPLRTSAMSVRPLWPIVSRASPELPPLKCPQASQPSLWEKNEILRLGSVGTASIWSESDNVWSPSPHIDLARATLGQI